MIQNNLKACSPRKVALLSSKHMRNRMEFAKQHLDWPVSKWRNIFYMDENKIVLYGGKGSRSHIRWPLKIKYNPRFTSNTIKHEDSSVMVWACFSYFRVGPIYWIKTITDQFVNFMYRKTWCYLMLKRKCLYYGSSNKTRTPNNLTERLVNGF